MKNNTETNNTENTEKQLLMKNYLYDITMIQTTMKNLDQLLISEEGKDFHKELYKELAPVLNELRKNIKFELEDDI